MTATNPSDAGATAEVTIKVTDEDEAPESSMARRAWPGEHGGRPGNIRVVLGGRYDGKGTVAVAIYTAAGPDAALAPWTLDGDDAGDFSNNAGMLTLSSSPDYEMPANANTDNTCMAAVK